MYNITDKVLEALLIHVKKIESDTDFELKLNLLLLLFKQSF